MELLGHRRKWGRKKKKHTKPKQRECWLGLLYVCSVFFEALAIDSNTVVPVFPPKTVQFMFCSTSSVNWRSRFFSCVCVCVCGVVLIWLFAHSWLCLVMGKKYKNSLWADDGLWRRCEENLLCWSVLEQERIVAGLLAGGSRCLFFRRRSKGSEANLPLGGIKHRFLCRLINYNVPVCLELLFLVSGSHN